MKPHLSGCSLLLLLLCYTTFLAGISASLLEADVCTAPSELPVTLGSAGATVRVPVLATLRKPGTDGFGCSQLVEDTWPSIKALEWAFNLLNKDSGTEDGLAISDSYIPGVKFVMTVFDTCGRRQVADSLIKDVFPDLVSARASCSANQTLLPGALGTTDSASAISLAPLLNDFGIPMISYAATQSVLSDRSTYPNFFRTVPSDTAQFDAIGSVLKLYNWTQIGILYTSDTYGKTGYSTLVSLSTSIGVCVAEASIISTSPTAAEVSAALGRLRDAGVRALVAIASLADFAVLFNEPTATSFQWIMSDAFGNPSALLSLKAARGLTSVGLGYRQNDGFATFYRNELARIVASTDPNSDVAFKQWYMQINNCRLSGLTNFANPAASACPAFNLDAATAVYQQNRLVEPAIDAAFVLAKAVQKLWQAKCAGARGICSALRNTSYDELRAAVAATDFTYSATERIARYASASSEPDKRVKQVKLTSTGDPYESNYFVYNLRTNGTGFAYVRVGVRLAGSFVDWLPGSVDVYDQLRDTVISVPQLGCTSTPCTKCLAVPPDFKYALLPGDLYLLAVFSVHNPGASPRSCGALNPSGSSELDAFLYSISQANSLINSSGLSGLTTPLLFGAVAIDDCSSPVLAQDLVDSLISGIRTIPGVDPTRIVGVIAAGVSTTTDSVSQLLASQQRSLISYRPAALSFSPYLYQTVPPSSVEVAALMATLNSLSVNYIQLVSSPDSVNRDAARLFLATAGNQRICVSAFYELGTNGTHASVMAQLRLRPAANTIVTLVTDSDAAIIVTLVTAPLQLIGGSSWGSTQSVISTVNPSQAIGSVTVGEPRQPTLYQSWSTRVRQLANETNRNPWYSEWYETLNQCSLSATNTRSYTSVCTGADMHTLNTSSRYFESAYTASVQRATAAYTQVIATRLRRVCSADSGVCSAFWYSGTGLQAEITAQFAGATNFTDLMGQAFSFVSRSVIDFGLSVYNVRNISGGLNYQTVGTTKPSFSLGTDLLLLANGVSALTSKCTDVSRCSECAPFLTGTPSYLYLSGDILIGVLVNVRSPGTSGSTCGGIKTSEGFAYTEAVRWTVNLINSGGKPDVRLGGSVKLGAIILDACGSSSVAINLVTSIAQGTLVLTDKVSGARIDASRIRSWLSYGDPVTVSLATVLRNLGGIPLISPSASSDDLTALSTFRTVPTALDQISAIISIIRSYAWKCVQLVYSNNDYGNRLATEFRVQALTNGICVPRCLQVVTDGSVASILTSIRADISKTRVVVVLTDNAADLLQLTTSDFGLIFIASNFWGERVNDGSLIGLGVGANNSWVIQANSPGVAPIATYLSGLTASGSTDNPWLIQYYEALFNCSTSGSLAYSTRCNNTWPITASPQFLPGLFTMATTNAIFSITRAYSDILSALCNSSYSTICSFFWSDPRLNSLLSDQLNIVNFTALSGVTFRFRTGRDGNMGWLALNRVGSTGYVPAARYMLGAFTQLPAYASRSPIYSSVPALCSDCTNCPKSLDQTEKFIYVPGQLLIAGIFDVHNLGTVPFSCGTINSQNGFLLTEVFKYAIESIPSSPIFSGKLRGVSIGGLAFDSCSSIVRSNSLVANLHSGSMVLRDSALNKIDPQNIMAYVATSTSEAADQLSKVTDVILAPIVSYAATMSSLSNKQLYPYFSRTVPSDDKVAYAIVDFLKRYRLNNIQFVLSPGVYGTSGLLSVQRAISNEGICISNTLQVNRSGLTTINADDIAAALLKRPQATVVIALLQYADLVEVLGAVSRNNQTADKFLFIGTTFWGNSKAVLTKIANGRYPRAITFGFETADLTDFERTYLLTKNPTTYTSVNPWFNEFYESLFQCTLSTSSPYYSRTCGSASMALSDSPNYSQDSLSLYVVNAVYSVALGVHNALVRICGAAYNGICSDFYGSGEKRQWVLGGIRSGVFVDATYQNFTIDSNGDSNRGYHIYQLQTAFSTPYYSSIGAYNDSALLKLRSDFTLDWNSNCSQSGSCDTVCPNLARNRSVYMQVNSSTMDLNIVQFLPVHSSLSASQCGPMDLQSGINNLIAFHYVLSLLNNNTDIAISGFKFGGLSIDVCQSETRTAAFAFSYAAGNGICSYAAFSDLMTPLTAIAYITQGSLVSTKVSAIVPDSTVVSPDATAIALSSKTSYPRFLRVVPPESLQIDALLDIAAYYNWSVVTLIYDTTESGLAGKAAFEVAIAKRNSSRSAVCVKFVPVPSSSAVTLADAKAALLMASKAAYVNALIVYLPEAGIRTLLTAIRDLNLQGRFVLLGLDTWADKKSVVDSLQVTALGAITLRQSYFTLPDLDRWVTEIGLAPARRKGIPVDWLEEFWQHAMKCCLTGSSVIQTQYGTVCDPSASLPAGSLVQNSGTYSTVLATYITAKGIADFQRAECGTVATDVCLYRMTQANRLATIYKYISNAQALINSGANNSLLFRFTSDGYGDRSYDVLNFVSTGTGFAYNTIGYWNQRFMVQSRSLINYGPDGSPLAATPSSTCPAGVDCGCPGNLNDSLALFPRPDVWERARTPWGAVLLALTTLGAAVTLIAIGYLALEYPRKLHGTAGTNYLGFACLVGILTLFAINIAFIAHATPVVCTIRRFGLSLAYTVVYSSLLVRSVVNWSLHRAAPGEGPAFTGLSHPGSLLGLAICLSLVSSALGAEWLILQRPDVTQLVAYEGVAWSRCSPTEFYDEGLALSCLYPAVLMLVAVVYSLLCWDAPIAGSRLVVLALLFSAGSQLCWGCVSTLTAYKWRDPSVFVGNLVAGAALLVCLFVRKMAQLCRTARDASSTEGISPPLPPDYLPNGISLDKIEVD